MPLSPKPCLPSCPVWPPLLLHNHSSFHEANVAKQLLFVSVTGRFVCALSKVCYVYCTIFGNKMFAFIHILLYTLHIPLPHHTLLPFLSMHNPFSHAHTPTHHTFNLHTPCNSPHTHLPSPCTHHTMQGRGNNVTLTHSTFHQNNAHDIGSAVMFASLLYVQNRAESHHYLTEDWSVTGLTNQSDSSLTSPSLVHTN